MLDEALAWLVCRTDDLVSKSISLVVLMTALDTKKALLPYKKKRAALYRSGGEDAGV